MNEEHKLKCRAYYLKHKEEILEKRKVNYYKKTGKIRASVSLYELNNPDQVCSSQRKWYLKNREKKIKQSIEYHKLNPEKHRKSGNLRRLNESKTSDKTITKKSIASLLEKQNYKCKICDIDITNKNHRDHIIPLSKGGIHSINNIQMLCPECNRRKSTKYNDEFLLLINAKS